MGVRVSKCTCLSGITCIFSLIGMQKRVMKKNGIKWTVWWLSVTCRKRGMQARSIHKQCSNSLGSCCTKRTRTGSKSWKRASWATHTQAERHEKWSRVVYEVQIHENGGKFECECGLFEHMGMPCCHMLKVMDVLGYT